MTVSTLKTRAAILFTLACIGGPAVLLPAAAGQGPPAPAGRGPTDQDKLQGRWQILSVALEDKVVTRENRPDAWKGAFQTDLTINGNRLGQAPHTRGRFTLDASRTPRQITIQDDDGKLTFRGIYALDGDTLKVCVNGDGTDVRRPEEIVTKKGTPLVVITLRRSPAGK